MAALGSAPNQPSRGSKGEPTTPASSPSVSLAEPPQAKPPRPVALVAGLLKTMRPHQWVKNVFVLAPVVFAKELFELDLLLRAGGAFAIFCLLVGAVYTINDIVDAPADRIHPIKRHRPIAAGVVPLGVARALAAVLLLVSMAAASYLSPAFATVALLYFLLNVAYSLQLKKLPYADVGCIALGFVLRVVAGGLATRIQVSGYLLVCTALLALFLGFGKRSHELAGLELATSKTQRAVLAAYNPKLLSRALALTGAASIVTYVAYTVDPSTRAMFHSDWLWLTAPPPVFGVLRFLHLVRARPKAESPTQEMLRDAPFMINLILWVGIVVAVVYRLRPSL
jgi:decaprenyl-phosphate phosphoribosyltransferase